MPTRRGAKEHYQSRITVAADTRSAAIEYALTNLAMGYPGTYLALFGNYRFLITRSGRALSAAGLVVRVGWDWLPAVAPKAGIHLVRVAGGGHWLFVAVSRWMEVPDGPPGRAVGYRQHAGGPAGADGR